MELKTKVECLKFNWWLMIKKYIDFEEYQKNIIKIRKLWK